MNKTIILSSLVIAIALFGYISHTKNQVFETPTHIRLAYQKWALSYKRLYASPQEQHFRLSVFEKTYNEVEKHNANKSATWTMELNQFSDMTMEEIKVKYLGDMSKIRDALDGGLMHEASPLTQIPSSVDHR
jgi:C1A family cysteine protease